MADFVPIIPSQPRIIVKIKWGKGEWAPWKKARYKCDTHLQLGRLELCGFPTSFCLSKGATAKMGFLKIEKIIYLWDDCAHQLTSFNTKSRGTGNKLINTESYLILSQTIPLSREALSSLSCCSSPRSPVKIFHVIFSLILLAVSARDWPWDFLHVE